MCFVPPPYFLREQILMFQIYKIMTVSAQPLIGIEHNKCTVKRTEYVHASLGPTGRRTYSTRETPALRDRERALKKVRQKKWG